MRRYSLAHLVSATIPLASFITFILQPLTGKILMPVHGGDIGTWMTCLLFFQLAILGAYALAALLRHASRRIQSWTIGLLAIAAPLSLLVPVSTLSEPGQVMGLFLGLSVSLLPTLLLCSSIAILCQGWIQDQTKEVPYHLFSLFQLGNLVALVAYPFLIEPYIDLSTQSTMVNFATLALSLLSLALLWANRYTPLVFDADPDQVAETPEHTPRDRILSWILLSFLASTVMMGGVELLSTELGSNPLAWIIPMGVYLLSYAFTFANLARNWLLSLATVLLALLLLSLNQGSLQTHPTLLVLWITATVGVASLVSCGLLFQFRPKKEFSGFYLCIALGGALGGIFCSALGPLIFDRPLELYIAITAILLLGSVYLLAASNVAARIAVAALALLPSLLSYYQHVHFSPRQEGALIHLRNPYSSLTLMHVKDWIYCTKGTVLQGQQNTQAPLRTKPTTYYCEQSGLGLTLLRLQKDQPSMKLGVVGLGIGTLAAYLRPADSMTFWELNPQMKNIAEDAFYYLTDAKGKVKITLGDGRRLLKSNKDNYDVLILDSFSGDAIPTHMLTREAIVEYMRHLPRGLLIAHVSSRYVHIWPVFAAHARALGLQARYVVAQPDARRGDPQDYEKASSYVILASKQDMEPVDEALAKANLPQGWIYKIDDGRDTFGPDWTDARHSVIEVLSPTAFMR